MHEEKTKRRSAAHETETRGWEPGAPRTLDELARLDADSLDDLYRGGRLFELSRLDGEPAGRMLALVGPLGRPLLRRGLARLAGASLFPWRGKSFHSAGGQRGEGINRVVLLGDKYRFLTRVEPSAIDADPCVFLDYDLPDNPFFIRAIRDELREVGPGLFLGPAMLGQASPQLILWFGIQH